MNYRFIINQLGLLFIVLSAIMFLMSVGFFGIESWLEHEIDRYARQALLFSGAATLLFGGVSWLATRTGTKQLGRREALLLVGVSWLLGAAFSALPYYFWALLNHSISDDHPFHSFSSCYFEAMSGLTTTGASVLIDIEAMPRSLLLWRAFTQWLGGLGIVVLFVAVLPSLGVGGKRLFRAEATGPAKKGVTPQIRDTARTLWYIYLGMTAVLLVLLRIAGMEWFDAVAHSFTTLPTGGFSTRNASIAAYDSTAIIIILTVFMAAGGINFALYYAILRGRFDAVLKDSELRLYLLLLVTATAIIAVSLSVQLRTFPLIDGRVVDTTTGNVLQYSAFTAVAIQTTTGFGTADYNAWPFLAKAALVALMFIGGSAGSTSSGIKVVRIWIMFKILHREIEHVFRPQVVRPVRVSQDSIDPELKLSTLAYVIGFGLLFAAGAVVIMLLEQFNSQVQCTFGTAATASIAMLANIGPGLEQVGPTSNYGWFSATSKWIMSILMVLGRLEIYAIIVLVTPRFWYER